MLHRAAMLATCLLALAPRIAAAGPASVTITGSLQSELGCSSDFQPGCTLSALARDPVDNIWKATLAIPAGTWQYFAALDGTFDQTFGRNGAGAFSPITLTLAAPATVRFFFDDATGWLTDNRTTPIAVLASSFQSELGCPADFDPACLRSWLQDLDGDNIYTLAAAIPDGTYSTVVAINKSFGETYGAGGVPGGPNIPLAVTGGSATFCYDNATHVLQTGAACAAIPGVPVPEPASPALMLAGMAGLSLLRRKTSGRTLPKG